MTPNDGENGLLLASPRSPEVVTRQAYRAQLPPQTHNSLHKRTTSGATSAERQSKCLCPSDYGCGPLCDHEGVPSKMRLFSAAALLALSTALSRRSRPEDLHEVIRDDNPGSFPTSVTTCASSRTASQTSA